MNVDHNHLVLIVCGEAGLSALMDKLSKGWDVESVTTMGTGKHCDGGVLVVLRKDRVPKKEKKIVVECSD